MSLCTDELFYRCLVDSDVKEDVDGRIFNPARNEEDENEDRIPYIIITHDGGQNEQESKDDDIESDTDNDNISILVVAEDRESLATLIELVRTTLLAGIRDDQEIFGFDFKVTDYKLTYSGVQLDPSRPCVFQTLHYQCEVNNIQS